MWGYLIDSGETISAVAVLCGLLALHPRTRRVGYALMRYGKRHAPRWAMVLMVAPIPGPVDEIAAIAGVLWMLRTQKQRTILRRYVKVAWSK